jgi:hypothetical protein
MFVVLDTQVSQTLTQDTGLFINEIATDHKSSVNVTNGTRFIETFRFGSGVALWQWTLI